MREKSGALPDWRKPVHIVKALHYCYGRLLSRLPVIPDPTPVKLSEVSENGARYSDRYNNLYMKNISYHEDDGFLEFMAQKTNRREDGSISVIWNLDFSGFKSKKEGALVIRLQNGGVSSHYDLAAFKCYALQ